MDDEEKFLYLKNVVYKYIIGGVHNAESLVRVIASILRFTAEEERAAIEKERSRSVCGPSLSVNLPLTFRNRIGFRFPSCPS